MTQPITIYYEHPEWFTGLFARLDERGVPYRTAKPETKTFDPSRVRIGSTSLFVNRMSPSAVDRGLEHAIPYTQELLVHLERRGVPVFNGSHAFGYEISKARQHDLLQHLGIATPRTLVARCDSQLLTAAKHLEFPVIVKPNVGGSGAGISRYDTWDELHADVTDGKVSSGSDAILLLQEYHSPEDGKITRVETVDGKFLYAIRVEVAPERGFNLCPADACRIIDGPELSIPKNGSQEIGLSVDRLDPPREVIAAVERIASAASLDAGGVEYLQSERDGQLYVYDINAMSNFVADPVRVLGFDPNDSLIDSFLTSAREKAA